MQAVQDHSRETRSTLTTARLEDRRALARKTSVQQLARAATRGIQNRRQRMEARIAIYNELIPVIEQQHRARRRLHQTYLPLVAGLGLALTFLLTLE